MERNILVFIYYWILFTVMMFPADSSDSLTVIKVTGLPLRLGKFLAMWGLTPGEGRFLGEGKKLRRSMMF